MPLEKIPDCNYNNAADFYRAAAPREQYYINSFKSLLNTRGYYAPKLSTNRNRTRNNRQPPPVRQQHLATENFYNFNEVADDGYNVRSTSSNTLQPTTITLETGVSFQVATDKKWIPSKLNYLFKLTDKEFVEYDFSRWQARSTTKVLQFLRSNFFQEHYCPRKTAGALFHAKTKSCQSQKGKQEEGFGHLLVELNLGHKALDRIGLGAVLRCDEVKATCSNTHL